MKIAIEAQRIFRPNKHGMDFVALETIRELQKMDHENEYFIFVSPGEDKCLESSDNVHIIELKCPTYPLWEQVALPHQQHGSSTLPCASGSNIARYNLSGKAPVVQPVVVSRDGMALSPVSRSAHTPQVRENYYRFAVRTETDS